MKQAAMPSFLEGGEKEINLNYLTTNLSVKVRLLPLQPFTLNASLETYSFVFLRLKGGLFVSLLSVLVEEVINLL